MITIICYSCGVEVTVEDHWEAFDLCWVNVTHDEWEEWTCPHCQQTNIYNDRT